MGSRELSSDLKVRKLRAPSGHGEVLIDPPLAEAAEQVGRNRAPGGQGDYDCQGRPLEDLSRQARACLLEQARQYTLAYRQLDPAAASTSGSSAPPDPAPILLAGHQPQLFHPGVWFKNFVLASLAGQVGGQAVNLLADNDTFGSSSIRVPRVRGGRVWSETVLLDRPWPDVPYEERTILDRELWSTFGRRVQQCLSPLIPDPLIEQLWPAVREASRATDNLGRCLAQGRHWLEGQWGLNTMELPLSAVCREEPFQWFAAHLLAHLPRLWQIYNTSLDHYRRANRVRSRSHPVPDLAGEQGWLEAPFWLWTRDAPQRRRLFVRRLAGRLELSDRDRLRWHLPLHAAAYGGPAVEQLAGLEARGIKLRPRALITTLYARLVLGDLFLHGIGGGKYDQLTDLLIRRFFGFEPPGFLVATATAWLPVERPPVSREQLREVDRHLRQLQYHPENYVETGDQAVRPLVDEKWRWIGTHLPRGQRRPRHEAITRINAALQPSVQSRRQQLLARRQELSRLLRHDDLLASRDYAFCLFPERTLRPLLTRQAGLG